MKIVGLVDEDFTQYKKPSMFIAFPFCSFKCEVDCHKEICQNSKLAKAEKIDIDPEVLVERYLDNPITKAIVCGGLDPVDTFEDLYELVKKVRDKTDDDIVIYTGYTEKEIHVTINLLSKYKNIIFKFGRFIPDEQDHFDPVLGINLASNNQYGKKVS